MGLKLHLVVNDQGKLPDCCLTPGNTDDRKPVHNLLKDCWGTVFADQDYVSKTKTIVVTIDNEIDQALSGKGFRS